MSEPIVERIASLDAYEIRVPIREDFMAQGRAIQAAVKDRPDVLSSDGHRVLRGSSAIEPEFYWSIRTTSPYAAARLLASELGGL